LASDGAGSIRVPASYCGVYGFRATRGRSTGKGHAKLDFTSRGKGVFLKEAFGPMAQSIDDMVLMLKALFNTNVKEFDPVTQSLPWRDDVKVEGKLNIGYQLSEDYFGVCKPNRRAILEAVEVLRKKGHNVFEIKIPNFQRIVMLTLSIVTSDGKNRGFEWALQGEKVIDELRVTKSFGGMPKVLRKVIRGLMALTGQKRAVMALDNTGELLAHELFAKWNEFGDLSQEFFNFWREKKLDAILSPVTALPAIKHGTANDLTLAACYCFIASLLNMPAGAMPIGIITEKDEIYGVEECKHKDLFFKKAAECLKESKGLPVGLQVMTLPWEDEKCMAIMRIIDEEIKFSEKYKLAMLK